MRTDTRSRPLGWQGVEEHLGERQYLDSPGPGGFHRQFDTALPADDVPEASDLGRGQTESEAAMVTRSVCVKRHAFSMRPTQSGS